MQEVDHGASVPDLTNDGLTYIVDEPASQDRFGAHSAIANAIISTIEKQSSIQLIGLFGRWGTGKSTIVGQLSIKVDEEHKHKYIVFAYDAWAHQGDPARRSILEELIARLVGLRLTKLPKWRHTLAEISGSTERSSTTTTTRLSAWGKTLVVLLLLLPMFASVIDSDTLRDAFKSQHDDLSLNLIRAFLFYFASLILVIALAYASSMNYNIWSNKDLAFFSRFKLFVGSGEDILSIMLTRQIPGSASTTLRSSQPTAIEFRRLLRRIIESQRPRRIIFVIDNLDRIDPTEALEIWSIMVGMVADEGHRINAALEPIVILPFDPTALEKIVPGSNLEGHHASDLIEKSFDVTFEVPPPVLSNWRTYFAEQYTRCGLWNLTNESSFERYWTSRNFEQCLGEARITPRKINRFLNRVISLSQQQVGRFSPTILSYYIAHETEIRADCLAFLKAADPGFDETNAWQRKMAAVAFGTTEIEAAQVLLGDELLDALNKRDADAFKGIEHVAGFDEVVRNFVESPPRNVEGGVDAAPLNALATFHGTTQPSTRDPVLWSRLWAAWKAATTNDADSFTGSTVVAFIDAIPVEAMADAPLLAARVVAQIKVARDPAYLKELINVGDKIASLATDEFEVDLEKDAALLLRIIGSAAETSVFAACLRCQCSFEDLATLVVERLESKIAILAAEDFRLVDKRMDQNHVAGDKESFFRLIGGGLKQILAIIYVTKQLASRMRWRDRPATLPMRISRPRCSRRVSKLPVCLTQATTASK